MDTVYVLSDGDPLAFSRDVELLKEWATNQENKYQPKGYESADLIKWITRRGGGIVRHAGLVSGYEVYDISELALLEDSFDE